MPDGYSLVLDNVDLRSGSPRAFRFPTFFRTVPIGTTRIWEFRGKWYFSPLWRDYAAEMVGNRERVYFTESGPGAVIPQKIIDGVQARLGTPAPGPALDVAKGSEISPLNLSFELVTGQTPGFTVAASNSLELEYMIGALDDNGVLLTLSNKVRPIIEGAVSGYAVKLTWNAFDGASEYQVYGREVGHMEELAREGSTTYTDNASLETNGTTAPDEAAATPYNYIYTFVRNVNGHEDESGPSPVSADVSTVGSRIVTRRVAAERIFVSGGALTTYVNPTPSIDALASSTAGAIDIMGIVSIGGKTTFVTDAAHGLTDGDTVGISALLPSDVKASWKVKLPAALNAPQDVSISEIASPGSTLPADTYSIKITGVRGARSILSGVPGGIFTDGRGAQTTASTAKSITTTGAGKAIEITCAQDAGFDCAYIYIDSGAGYVFQGVLNPSATWKYTFVGQAADYSGAGTPTIPTNNETRTQCFVIEGLDGTNPSGYPDDGGGGKVWPQMIPNPVCHIEIATASDPGLGTTRTAKISGFTDDSINGIFTATGITYTPSLLAFDIPAFLAASELSVSQPYTVEFADATDDYQFYKWWNLYRTDNGEWLRVAQLPLDVTTYEDKKPSSELGGPPDSWYTENDVEVLFRPPPSGLHSIVTHYGMEFGCFEHTVRWTPVNRPDAWPDAFQISFPYRPYALASWKGTMIVLCSDAIYHINGTIPTILTRFKTEAEVGILAPRSVQKTEKGLLYLGAPGVMLFNGNSAICITENRIPASFWQSPSRLSVVPNFFWYPTEITYNYAALSFDPGGYGDSGVPAGNPAVANILNRPIQGPIYNIRSMYHNGKYYLFWSDYF